MDGWAHGFPRVCGFSFFLPFCLSMSDGSIREQTCMYMIRLTDRLRVACVVGCMGRAAMLRALVAFFLSHSARFNQTGLHGRMAGWVLFSFA